MKTLREIQGRAYTIRVIKWRLFQIGWFLLKALIALIGAAAFIALIYGIVWFACFAIKNAFGW